MTAASETRARRFLAALPQPLRERARPDGALEAALAELLAKAHAAWPAIALDDDDFLAHVAQRLADDDELTAILPALCAADLYLALAALRGDAAAVRALCDGPLGEAVAVTRRHGGDAALADDVYQRVSTLLLVSGASGATAKLESYGGRGSLRAFVRVIAARELHRMRSHADRERPTESSSLFDAVMAGDDPERAFLKASYRSAFRDAFEHAVGDLSMHDRLLLRQHFLDGLTIDQVCTLHRVHRTTAARWLGGVRDKLYRATRRHFQATMALDGEEFEELLRLIQSQLDASIERLLASSS